MEKRLSMDLKLVECPRDAMQGIHDFIPTHKKVAYINAILKCGFDTVDFGSFVSPKAIPQMKDTADVLKQLDLSCTHSKLLAIVANERGATDACNFDEIKYLGYPFSISETFQKRNTNASIDESLKRVESIQNLCHKYNKEMVVYISMAFGNPYGDPWDAEVAAQWSERLHKDIDIPIIALSDTIGVSNPDNIDYLFSTLIPEFPNLEIGAHLHSTPDTIKEKVEAAYTAGCRRYDGAIKGYGGCPMAKDDLTGNMQTETMLDYFKQNEIAHGINEDKFNETVALAAHTFPL
jgi:hydroxymethylglutaryl-CoA lyase